MERPRIVVHNTVSLDGQLTGFPVDLGLHYEIAATIRHDAILTGSTTLLAAAQTQGVDLDGEDPDEPAPAAAIDDPRPWLVVVDSRARLARLSWLRGQPYWRDVLILCSQVTPAQHLDRLRRHGIEHLVTGADRVDLPTALRALADRYGVTAVRVDAGGTLNGQLLAAGLVDEIDLIVAPHLAGTGQAHPVHLIDAISTVRQRLTLVEVGQLSGSHLRLRYSVSGPEQAEGAARTDGQP